MRDIESFARAYTVAWCSQDPEAVAAFFAPGGSLAINGGEPSVGRGAIADSARSFMTAFPDLQVLMDAVEVAGERVLYRWTLLGTNSGPGGRGHKVRIHGQEEWTMGEDGLVAASLGSFDAEEYRRQVEGG